MSYADWAPAVKDLETRTSGTTLQQRELAEAVGVMLSNKPGIVAIALIEAVTLARYRGLSRDRSVVGKGQQREARKVDAFSNA